MTEQSTAFRLSTQQARALLLAEAGGSTAARCAVEAHGPLDSDRLRRAVEDVVARHEALRTAVAPETATTPALQRVLPLPQALAWGADAELDLLDGPVVRVSLTSSADHEHLLVLESSTLAVDDRSLATVAAEIARAYAAGVGDEEPVQYLQVAAWQEELHTDAEGETSRRFWQRRIDAVADSAPLPFEVTVGAGPAAGLLDHAFALPEEVAHGLEKSATEFGTTPAHLILACWAALLARLSDRPSVTVELALDGRSMPELDDAVGPFAHLVPLTVAIGAQSALADVTAEIDGAGNAMRDHQDYVPQASLVRVSGAPGPAFAFRSTGQRVRIPADGVEFALRESFVADSAAHLTLVAADAEPAALLLRAQPGRFLPGTLEILADQLGALIAQAVAAPDRPLAAADLLTGHAAALFAAANDTAGPAPFPAPFAGRFVDEFLAQAERTPERTAVTDATGRLTYRSLAERSAAMAAVLRERGVGPESLVALLLPPGNDAVSAMLGIARAGGAWLPLDPQWPAAWATSILRDATPTLAVAPPDRAAVFADLGIPVLGPDQGTDAAAVDAGPDGAAARSGAENLAYLIYTSGSTGTPKGVAVTHGGLANYLGWAREAYGIDGDAVSLVHSALSFDLTITSVLTPLLAGGAVRFCDPPNVEGLIRGIGRSGVNLLKLTPSHLRLLGEIARDAPPAQESGSIVIGGEALTDRTLALWRELLPGVALVNEYGPTETVVGCCVHHDRGPTGRAAVPIGTPIANTRLYVLDGDLRRVGVGESGELYIAGAGLARGYLRRPALTAERFVPDPFGTVGGRLYRTGDLVRYLPDGGIEYIGRTDDQVQVQGYRVELGDIEAVAAGCPGVAAAAAAVHGEGRAAAVHAYVTAAAGARPDPAALREHLAERLPGYLLPATITVLDELPLSGNGKVDRGRLPVPQAPVETPAAPVAAGPRAPISVERMTELWAEVLGYEVSPYDNFFDVGGTSFLLVDLAGRLEQECGEGITVLTVLEHPTIAGLSGAINALLPTAEAPAGDDEARDRAQRQRDALSRRRNQNRGEQ